MDSDEKQKATLIDWTIVAAILLVMFITGTVQSNVGHALGFLIFPGAATLFFFALSSFLTSSRIMQRVVLVVAGSVAYIFFYWIRL